MKTVSLRSQINIRILLTSIVILIFGTVMTIWQARISVKADLDTSLNLAAQLIKINLFEAPSHDHLNVHPWLPRFVALEQTRHLTIAMKQADGRVINFAGSGKPAHDAHPPKWFIRLISVESQKIEKILANGEGEQINLIIQADPIDEITEAWQESQELFAILLIMALLTFIAVNLVFVRSFNAISVIVGALKSIEQGHYQQSLPDFSTKEYDSIAKAVNHMTGVLAETSNENKALTLHSLQIQEEERRHLAKELHDELGQSLTAIKVMAAAAKTENADTGQIADTIISVCEHLISVVRSMMRNLHPLALSELGLKAGLEDLIHQWSQRHPELALTLNCPESVDRLEQNITIQIFRIVQECLTNIIRHAKADKALITLAMPSQNLLCLEVCDTGCGCALNETRKGFGLLGIRERIQSLGGDLAIETKPRQGMKIKATVPLT